MNDVIETRLVSVDDLIRRKSRNDIVVEVQYEADGFILGHFLVQLAFDGGYFGDLSRTDVVSLFELEKPAAAGLEVVQADFSRFLDRP